MTAFDSQSAVFYGHVMVVGPACLLLRTFVVNVPIFAASSELGAWKELTLHRKVLRLRRNSDLRQVGIACECCCTAHSCVSHTCAVTASSGLRCISHSDRGSHGENVLLPTGRTLTGFQCSQTALLKSAFTNRTHSGRVSVLKDSNTKIQ